MVFPGVLDRVPRGEWERVTSAGGGNAHSHPKRQCSPLRVGSGYSTAHCLPTTGTGMRSTGSKALMKACCKVSGVLDTNQMSIAERTWCKFLSAIQTSMSSGKDTPQKCDSNIKSAFRRKLWRQEEFGFPNEILVQITSQQKQLWTVGFKRRRSWVVGRLFSSTSGSTQLQLPWGTSGPTEQLIFRIAVSEWKMIVPPCLIHQVVLLHSSCRRL